MRKVGDGKDTTITTQLWIKDHEVILKPSLQDSPMRPERVSDLINAQTNGWDSA